MLTFDPVLHRYAIDGVVLPSVTQILQACGCYDFSMVPRDVLEHKREIGKALHLAVALDIDNDLVEESVHPEVLGYLRSWRSFRADLGLTDADFGYIEQPLAHHTYRFAGTPDMTLFMEKAWGVLDLHTAADLHPAWALQTAAYKELVNTNAKKGQSKVQRRWALRLAENGTYKLDEHQDRSDLAIFLAMYSVRQWCAANLKGA